MMSTETHSWDIDALRADTPGCAHRVHLNNAGAALMSRQHPGRDDRAPATSRRSIGGYEAAEAPARHRTPPTPRLARLVGGHRRRDRAVRQLHPRLERRLLLRPVPAPATASSPAGPSTAATSWPTSQVAQRTGAEVVVVPNDEHRAARHRRAGRPDRRADPADRAHPRPHQRRAGQPGRRDRADRPRRRRALPARRHPVGRPVPGRRRRRSAATCSPAPAASSCAVRAAPASCGSRSDALDRLDPYVVEIGSATWDGDRGFTWADGARRFETWENSYVNVLGLGAAVRQALDLGLDAIGARARRARRVPA